MVPFGLSPAQFQQRYKRCLERASKHFIAELRTLFALPVPDSVADAEVQIFFGEDGLETPSAWIYYRGDNNKVDSNDPSIFPGRAMELSLGLGKMDAFHEDYFLDDEFDGLSIAANTIQAWFAECWWKAGGWSYAVPVTAWVHDGFGDGAGIELSERR
ncbi:hypothetical protein AB6N01_20020 [Alcaligenes nematophilus]|uniref:hypothetical protein n=1 Tax=Alcaligenes TaxID=507 RepID=UPI0002AA7684|nr:MULTISPECIES: hypothetical protein [Alcaligenes]EKU30363.1 hypothetical protein C660_08974 [Alcaligenes sp. HPC1271]ERT55221.1 hypothetical protein N879_15200 [Alcaligenes sp. EGD-AK7]UTM02235.1 hypothetical protein MID00_02120 [Alcaligenes sp. NLF5-7]HRO21469.1 hypothetical protein [Alcaligenes phenolicus]HRP15673.1 hypothetical protein [Alcaligenes phenolicus]